MRVLVTGGRGFLGRRLMPLLAEHEVMSLVRAVGDDQPGIRTVAGDITRDGRWQQEIEDFAPEWCIHLAWDGLPDYSLARCRANLDASVAVLQTLVRAKVRRVVVAGSCWEYGRAVGAVREEASPIDCGVFAATKHAVRKMLEGVSCEAGFDYRWARIFFVYGPGQRSVSLIPHLHASFARGTLPTLREPNAVQDFVHVDDVARGLLMLAQCRAPSGIFNLGSGQPTSVGEIANRVARHYGQSPPFTCVDGGAGLWADMSRTNSQTEWRPEIGIADGIDMTLHELDGKT
ncbi:MAG: NAD(P)-dependent oxidoreductase [Chloroflexi bacterium]|nr:NAD(P)-dependent oxidoreductase [Chloroflexota bacterium]